MFLSLVLIVVSSCLIYAYLKYYFAYWSRRGIPHEKPYLIFGNLKGLGDTLRFNDIHKRVYRKFKGKTPFTGMFFVFTKTALILDLDLIKSILIKDFSNFHDRGLYHNVRDDPLSGNLINIEGAQWRSLRNKLTPTFTSGKMKFMFPTVIEVSKRLVNACLNASMEDKRIVEIKELCACFTTDVIGTCAFGLECNSLNDPNSEFRQIGRSILEKPRYNQIIQSFMLFSPKLASIFRLKVITDEVNDFILKAVRDTISYRIKNNIRRHDFMDLMIELKMNDDQYFDDIDISHGLTMEQIAAQAFVFFIAGFETSSTTMSFCLYELALSQDIQNQLRHEINTVIENHEGKFTYEGLSEMVYLEQVLNETLRMYSLLPHLVRKTISDYKIPGSDLIIEAGTTIAIPIEAIHHDHEYYPEPEKFDPSRFEADEIIKRHIATYLPFGDGPRNCIGMRFGKLQTKIGLAMLLRHFQFSKSSITEVPLEFSKKTFTLAAKNGIHLQVTRL